MADVTKIIRVYEDNDEDEFYQYEEIAFDLTHLAHTVPVVGDLIIDPFFEHDHKIPANRTVYEVIARYFTPGACKEDFVEVAIVVKKRTATRKETLIIGKC